MKIVVLLTAFVMGLIVMLATNFSKLGLIVVSYTLNIAVCQLLYILKSNPKRKKND